MDDKSEPRVWRHRLGEFKLGSRTLLMGIVNVTPDSFSDGGAFLDSAKAVAHASRLAAEGADLIDIGAESTRPGSVGVPADVQIQRLLPVLKELKGRLRIPISVDTSSADVAAAALAEGAALINDVSGFHADASLPRVCAAFGAGIVLMHMQGSPSTMQMSTQYENLVAEIHDSLHESVSIANASNIRSENIVVDPGIGFGKTFDQNHILIANLSEFKDLASGVLVGPSRKAFTGEISGKPADERQFATAAAVTLSILNGADIVRVHDVAQMREVADFVDRHREIVHDCKH